MPNEHQAQPFDDLPRNPVDTPLSTLLANLLNFLRHTRFDLSTEKHLQNELATALNAHGYSFERELSLSKSDIPDFFLPGGIVIECKIRKKISKADVYKQLCRYASHHEVLALVLASNLSIDLPPFINGKPVHLASLSVAWL